MKNARNGLLFLSVFISLSVDAKQQNNNQKKSAVPKHRAVKPAKPAAKRRAVVAAPVADVVREEETHTVQETVRPLERNEYVAPSVQKRYEQEEDGDLKETVTTVEVQDNQVITKTESWTIKDYAKAAAIGAGALGAIGAGYYYSQNQDAVNQGASDLYGKGQEQWNNASASLSNWLGLSPQAAEAVADSAQAPASPVVNEITDLVAKEESGEPLTVAEQNKLQAAAAWAQENPGKAALIGLGGTIGTGYLAKRGVHNIAAKALRNAGKTAEEASLAFKAESTLNAMGKSSAAEVAEADQVAKAAAQKYEQISRQSPYTTAGQEVKQMAQDVAQSARSGVTVFNETRPWIGNKAALEAGIRSAAPKTYNAATRPLTKFELAEQDAVNQGIIANSNVNISKAKLLENRPTRAQLKESERIVNSMNARNAEVAPAEAATPSFWSRMKDRMSNKPLTEAELAQEEAINSGIVANSNVRIPDEASKVKNLIAQRQWEISTPMEKAQQIGRQGLNQAQIAGLAAAPAAGIATGVGLGSMGYNYMNNDQAAQPVEAEESMDNIDNNNTDVLLS